MAAITKASTVDYDAISAQRCVQISELMSGDSFAFLDPVYIDTAGLVKAANADSTITKYDGFASRASDSLAGVPVTILGAGLIMTWLTDSDAYSPGSLLYVGASGGLADAAIAGAPAFHAQPVAKVISTTEIIVLR